MTIDIPGNKSFVKMEPIDDGLSRDRKFYVESSDDRKLLLRLSDIDDHDWKKAGFERMVKINAAGIPMSHPVEFGLCNGAKNVCLIT